MIVFDIETGPLPEKVLWDRVDPFEPAPAPGEFDPKSVKLGNLKDQKKIDAKIDAARKEHAQKVATYEDATKLAEEGYWSAVLADAPLDPLLGRVLAIGYHSTEKDTTLLDIEEMEGPMLDRFWWQYGKCRGSRWMVGHNIFAFDLPFLIRRSWLCDIKVPDGVFDPLHKWLDARTFKDTMLLWACGSRKWVKLDRLAKAMGGPGKMEGVDGSMFHELLRTDRSKAEEYLAADVKATLAVAEKLGLH